MKSETRRYKVSGFRDCGKTVRVILDPAELIKKKDERIKLDDMINNPMGAAQRMMNNQMNQMIHDTFSITREEYRQKQYMVGEFIIVTLQRE